MKMWTVQIRDQTSFSVQFNLDLNCPQKLLVSSSVRKGISVHKILRRVCVLRLLQSSNCTMLFLIRNSMLRCIFDFQLIARVE